MGNGAIRKLYSVFNFYYNDINGETKYMQSVSFSLKKEDSDYLNIAQLDAISAPCIFN